ncbi:MAG: hypothetical protein NDI90_19775, partial [Nitrospira sp. BO4]|nr:hypothetical protein [Nitrospira sp. BO4]
LPPHSEPYLGVRQNGAEPRRGIPRNLMNTLPVYCAEQGIKLRLTKSFTPQRTVSLRTPNPLANGQSYFSCGSSLVMATDMR